MHTRVCDTLEIELPIFGFSHCRDVVAAVTNAGGFGVLGATDHSPEELEVDLAWIEAQTDGRGFGVDLLSPGSFAGAESGGLHRSAMPAAIPEEHRDFVESVLDRYDVPPLPEHERGRIERLAAVSPEEYEPLVDVAFSHRIRLVASALGPPPPTLVERARDAGVVIAGLVGAPKHALRHIEAGTDLIVAQGTEAGGHTGDVSTMVLVPQVVDAVRPVPVLAAGGIATGRHVAAAMALGAEGVWCGSVWLTTEEAETHPAVVEKFLAASCSDTVRSRSLTGKPARMLRSAWTDEWESELAPLPLPMPLQGALVEEAQRRISRAAAARQPGANDLANYFVGQLVGYLDAVRPVRRVILDMVTEYADVVERFHDQNLAPAG